MKSRTHHRSLRLDAALNARVEKEAASQGRSVAELVRLAIEQYLAGQALASSSDIRLRRVCEYAQLALDEIIKENHPELRDLILAETTARMERYHGTR